MKVAAIQHDIAWEDPKTNFGRLAPQIAAAAATGARMVVLTEMFATGFSMNTRLTAEPPDGPSTAFLVDQARDLDVWTCATLAERAPGSTRPTNTCVLAAPDGTVHRYRKIHPFTYGGEHEHFAPGDAFTTVDVEGLRVTLFVCYDLRFADEFWATAADTDCYVVPANWPAGRRDHWKTLLDARAIENQAYVVGVNRVGKGGNGLPYCGDSRIVDPSGNVLASAAQQEALLVTEVDPSVVAATRERYPFAQDRR
jgi:predicted amidohydrolase